MTELTAEFITSLSTKPRSELIDICLNAFKSRHLLELAVNDAHETLDRSGLCGLRSVSHEALRLRVENVVVRVEAAESLVAELRDAAIAYRDTRGQYSPVLSIGASERLNAVLDKTPASVVSKLAELEKELASARAFGDEEERRVAAFRAESASKDAELARLREEIKMVCDFIRHNFPDVISVEAFPASRAVFVMRNQYQRITALRARVSELESENASYSAHGTIASLKREVVETEQRAERLADALRTIRDMGFPTHDRPSADILYKHVDIARAALADQPAQPITKSI